MHRRLHQLHDAHGDKHLHRQPSGGGFLCHSFLLAADGRLGCDINVVLGQGVVQGGELLSGELSRRLSKERIRRGEGENKISQHNRFTVLPSHPSLVTCHLDHPPQESDFQRSHQM